jgi:hypothetical protein
MTPFMRYRFWMNLIFILIILISALIAVIFS